MKSGPGTVSAAAKRHSLLAQPENICLLSFIAPSARGTKVCALKQWAEECVVLGLKKNSYERFMDEALLKTAIKKETFNFVFYKS